MYKLHPCILESSNFLYILGIGATNQIILYMFNIELFMIICIIYSTCNESEWTFFESVWLLHSSTTYNMWSLFPGSYRYMPRVHEVFFWKLTHRGSTCRHINLMFPKEIYAANRCSRLKTALCGTQSHNQSLPKNAAGGNAERGSVLMSMGGENQPKFPFLIGCGWRSHICKFVGTGCGQ